MKWRSVSGSEHDTKILHLKRDGEDWKPYHQCMGLVVPDHAIEGGSRGFATAQKLLRCGWVYEGS